MLILGIILIIAGAASYIYGNNMNNSLESQFSSLMSSGTVDPGSKWITLGVIAAVIGVLVIIYSLVKKKK